MGTLTKHASSAAFPWGGGEVASMGPKQASHHLACFQLAETPVSTHSNWCANGLSHMCSSPACCSGERMLGGIDMYLG